MGDGGDDVLSGGVGNDTVMGGNGNDTVIGGNGNDTLTGGNGADTFVFAAGSGTDTITDFGTGADRIRIIVPQTDFDDLSIANRRGDAVVTWDGATLTLTDVDHGTLDTEDFLFA
ncbi:MAG: hypothetical protein GDA36_07010 [Rhodobacteraceae bacterium]|nr:hypothetical protein [Paracoccaceae bacterium]